MSSSQSGAAWFFSKPGSKGKGGKGEAGKAGSSRMPSPAEPLRAIQEIPAEAVTMAQAQALPRSQRLSSGSVSESLDEWYGPPRR